MRISRHCRRSLSVSQRGTGHAEIATLHNGAILERLDENFAYMYCV